jgi:branched-subunit amino acid ABC-type transport system permease component
MCVGMIQSMVTSFWTAQAVVGVTFMFAILILVFKPTGFSGQAH